MSAGVHTRNDEKVLPQLPEYFSEQSWHSLQAVVGPQLSGIFRATARVSKPEWSFGPSDVMKILFLRSYSGRRPGAAKVESALEQLSPTASLIRNARVNQ